MAENASTLSLDFLNESIKRKFSKPGNTDTKTIGLELELFPFVSDGSPFPGVSDIMNENLNGTYDLLYANSLCRCSIFDPDKKLDIPRLNAAAGGIVTFEPGGQIEYSSSADTSLKKAMNELIVHMAELENILAANQVWFFFGAMNPWQSVEDVGLKMQKPRYRAMDRYFHNIGPFGQQMMRLSGSIQVNLDFGHDETGERRWLATNLLSPVFCAIFGNSPFLAGKPTGYKSYRSIIWQNLDNSRTGFPHLKYGGEGNRDVITDYLDFALNANVFTLPDETGCLGYCDSFVSFNSWLENGYNGFYPSIEDWESHLTTLFPEVRAKGFMECRFMDGQAKPNWAVPAVLATALVYDDQATEQVIELLGNTRDQLDTMVTAAARHGVAAFPELCRGLFNIALNIKDYPIESELLAYCERFYKHYTERSLNPADELLSLNNGSVFAEDQYRTYEDRLFDLIQPPAYVAAKNVKELARDCKC